MKKMIILGAVLASIHLSAAETPPALHFNPPPREIKTGKEMTTLVSNGKCDLEIVVPEEAGETAKYAGEELRKFLQQGCGVKIPLKRTRSGAKYAIILGDNALRRKAFPEFDPAKLTRDGFYILRKNGDIYIAGHDDKSKQIRKFLNSRSGTWWNDTYFERGTLFGAYDFMERFAGIRFFFDGEIGTVVPKLKELKIPASIHIMDRPDFTPAAKHPGWSWKKTNGITMTIPFPHPTGITCGGVWRHAPFQTATDSPILVMSNVSARLIRSISHYAKTAGVIPTRRCRIPDSSA